MRQPPTVARPLRGHEEGRVRAGLDARHAVALPGQRWRRIEKRSVSRNTCVKESYSLFEATQRVESVLYTIQGGTESQERCGGPSSFSFSFVFF